MDVTVDGLAERCSDANYKAIFGIVRDAAKSITFMADGTTPTPVSHSSEDIARIQGHLFDAVKTHTLASCGGFTTVQELSSSLRYDPKRNMITQDASGKIMDGFYNPMSGIGGSNDPGMASSPYMPLVMGPQEVTALYASGGVAQIIIDKKSKGVMLNGFQFLSNQFTAQELKDLQEHAESKGFSDAVGAGVRDGNIYGGSVVFPMFYGDTPITTAMNEQQLIKARILKQGCISHFAEADRWNLVVVPHYDVSAADYMTPNSFYVPISGIEVHTGRAAIIKPKPMPYWGAIRQLGWGEPDSVGYMRSLIGYQIMMASIPIMAQQMSLLIHQLPLEGIIAMNGPEAARKWQKENEDQLRDWSMLNPKAINSYGEITAINRTYAGYGDLVDALRKDVSAQCGIPESVIFFTQPSGIFNKTEEDILLKQSETIRLIQRTIAPSINKIIPYLAMDLWGAPEGEKSWNKYKTLRLSFDTPVVSSPSEKAEIGRKFAETISLFTSSGLSIKDAFSFAKKILGEVEIPEDLETQLTSLPSQKPLPLVESNVSGADKAAPVQENKENEA